MRRIWQTSDRFAPSVQGSIRTAAPAVIAVIGSVEPVQFGVGPLSPVAGCIGPSEPVVVALKPLHTWDLSTLICMACAITATFQWRLAGPLQAGIGLASGKGRSKIFCKARARQHGSESKAHKKPSHFYFRCGFGYELTLQLIKVKIRI